MIWGMKPDQIETELLISAFLNHWHFSYSKCPKVLYTKVADKILYANSIDPDQTAPKGAVWSGSILFAFQLSVLSNNCIKSKILAKIVRNKC